MKNRAILSMAFIGTFLSCFALASELPVNQKARKTVSQEVTVVQLNRLTDNDLKEIMEGKHPELAVEFAAQTHLPVSFYLKGDLVNLEESNEKWATIEVKQTFYARWVEEALILSSNLTEWKPLMEFITGTATAAFSIQDGQLSILLGSETNRRR